MQVFSNAELDKKVNALYQKSLMQHQQGHLAEAQSGYRAVLQMNARHFGAMHMLGVTAFQSQKPDVAIDLIEKAIQIDPHVIAAHVNIGMAFTVLGRFEDANRSYERALELNPNLAELHANRCILLQEMKRPEDALEACDKAIALRPELVEAYLNRGGILQELKRHEDALISYDHALKLRPDFVQALNNKGNVLRDIHRPDEALVCYERAVEINRDYFEAHSNRGNALQDLGRLNEAIAAYDVALSIRSDYMDAYINKGNALLKSSRGDEAITCYDKVLSVNPSHADAYNNRGNAFNDLKQFHQAVSDYERAISLRPNYAEAFNNYGGVLMSLSRADEALKAYERAIQIKPDFLLGYLNFGDALRSVGLYEDAIRSYEGALGVKPDGLFIKSILLHTRMLVCDWSSFHENIQELTSELKYAEKPVLMFPLLALIDDPALHKKLACLTAETYRPSVSRLGDIQKYENRLKIKIGYYSADFHNHATSYLMEELFKVHDRNRFEIVAFSFGPNLQDDMRARLESIFDVFVDVRDKSDLEIASYSRELNVDIAVDLKGYTKDSRTGIFANRCAPLQVNYLGYPGTMGAEYVDYVIADKVLIGSDELNDYTEKVVRLPGSYQVNNGNRAMSAHSFTRLEVGLPENGFVFCCFNNNYKILPDTFDAWMRILSAVNGSVLWLYEDNALAAVNLRKEAQARGIHPDRLVFAKFMPLVEHLARLPLADLFIDTLPYNAHTTASDALWAGLPVLTLKGRSFAARVASSLLTAVHLPELIAGSCADFEAKAIELATDASKLASIRVKLNQNREVAPLFDTNRFAKELESAYTTMYERYQADLPAVHFDVN